MPVYNPAGSGGGTLQQRLALPGRFETPTDFATSGNLTLPARYNYFKNLTVNNGHTLTGVGGGTLLVVEETLQIVAGGVISVNALGGRGGASVNNAPGAFGFGGGPWRPNLGAFTITQGQFLSVGAIAAGNPWERNILTAMMPVGGVGGLGGGNNPGAVGSGPFPEAARGVFGGATVPPAGWELIEELLRMMRERPTDDATTGGIGGGGGGSGAGGNGAGAGGAGGMAGTGGAVGASNGAGGGGGSGFGVGGGGGSGVGAAASGAGGRGGGVLIIVCGTLNNLGIISADASAGAGTGNASGGGGGGGGGAVVVGYETLTALGTLRALSGGGGATGSGGTGAAGTAGLATSFQVSVP